LWLKLSGYQMPVVTKKYLSGFRIEPSTISKTRTGKLLFEDEKVLQKYTNNLFIIGLHNLHNFGRKVVGEIVLKAPLKNTSTE
jgi:hypothetical protein